MTCITHYIAAYANLPVAISCEISDCRGNEKKPRRIAALKGVNIVQAACGGWHCLAVSNTGQAYAWGGNEYGQCGVAQGKRDVPEPTPCIPDHKVVQVAAGGMHTCALTESGQVCAGCHDICRCVLCHHDPGATLRQVVFSVPLKNMDLCLGPVTCTQAERTCTHF